MKTLFVILSLSLLMSGICLAADQPQNIGYVDTDGPVGIWNRTLAQMNALAPLKANQMIIVSDAVQSRVCVSSGTGAGAWVVATATGTFVGNSYTHCN